MSARDPTLESWRANAAPWIHAIREAPPASRAITSRALLAEIARAPPRRLLDAGCGEGWLVRAVRTRHGSAGVGVDGVRDLIAAARACDRAGRYHCSSYRALVARGTLRGQRFDVVVCNFALFGSSGDAALLRWLASRLRPAGRLLLQTVPAPRPGATRIEEHFAHWNGNWTPMPYRARPAGAWRGLCRRADLAVRPGRVLRAPDGTTVSMLLCARKRRHRPGSG